MKMLGTLFIFLWAFFMLWAMTLIFPLNLIVLFSFVHALANPFIWVINKGGGDIEYPEPFVDEVPHNFWAHVAGIFLPIWGPFHVAYIYYITGKNVLT